MYHRLLLIGLYAVGATMCACNKDSSERDGPTSHEPAWSADYAHPSIAGFEPGVTELAQITAAFPDSRVDRDTSLGGDMLVMVNDQPAVVVAGQSAEPAEGAPLGWNFKLVEDAEGTLRLKSVELTLASGSACGWLDSRLADLHGTTTCAGTNRAAGNGVFCVGSADRSRRIDIECQTGNRGDHLRYWLTE